jgi:hypothetical protein
MTILFFPLDIAAQRLGVTKRWLMEWLRVHPCDDLGRPFYRKAGRTKLFTDSDVRRIYEALPTPAPAPGIVVRHPRRSLPITSSSQRTYEQELAELERLLGKKLTSPSASGSGPAGTKKSPGMKTPRRRS